MTVLICDRCGKTMKPYYSGDGPCSTDCIKEISKIKIPAFDENGNYVGIESFDLCPDCIKELRKFINKDSDYY